MFNYTFSFGNLVFEMKKVIGNIKSVKKMFKEMVIKTFGKIPKGADIEVLITKFIEPMFI